MEIILKEDIIGLGLTQDYGNYTERRYYRSGI